MRKLAFLLLPEFSSLGLAAATEPLFIANWLAQQPLFSWTQVSVDGQPVRASNGRMIAVDGDLAAAADAKSVFVLASFDPQAVLRERRVIAWLKRLARFGVEIGGIENGSLVLAEAGLLNGHQVAVHWDNLIGFRERYPKTRAVSQMYCRSGGRITCAGATAILDMIIAWMTWHGESDLVREVAGHDAGTCRRTPDLRRDRRPRATFTAATGKALSQRIAVHGAAALPPDPHGQGPSTPATDGFERYRRGLRLRLFVTGVFLPAISRSIRVPAQPGSAAVHHGSRPATHPYQGAVTHWRGGYFFGRNVGPAGRESASNSSNVRGQSAPRRRDRPRSASTLPFVWHRAQ
jgi:putative intracellular protease/amidase